MVDIVDCSVGVDQLNEILDNFDDVILGKYTHLRVGVKTEFLVNTISTTSQTAACVL